MQPKPLHISHGLPCLAPSVYCVQHLSDTRAPLQHKEQQAIAQLPGVSDWQAAAAACAPPETYTWDVFISHAGNAADKPFARALKALLERTGWGLRVFLDDESLQPGGDPQHTMHAAMESTAVAVLLFSAEFFERTATGAELQVLTARHALHRVQLLPVFLRMRVEDCKRSLADLLGQGASALGPLPLQWYAMRPCSSAIKIGHVKLLCCALGTTILHSVDTRGLTHSTGCLSAENVNLPTGIRHLGEASVLQPGMPKMERETLWHIVHALSVLLLKDFSAGVARYAASEQSSCTG